MGTMTGPTPAARALEAWLARKGESQTAFAQRTGIDRIQIIRIIKGSIRRISADTAVRIFEGTSGGVPLESFKNRARRHAA